MGLRDRVALNISIIYFTLSCEITKGVTGALCRSHGDTQSLGKAIDPQLIIPRLSTLLTTTGEIENAKKLQTLYRLGLERSFNFLREFAGYKIYSTLCVPCLFGADKDNFFYDIFFSIKNKTDSVIIPEMKKEIHEPITQQSQYVYKDLSAESLLKAFNFPKMEYSPSFYPEQPFHSVDKLFTHDSNKRNSDFLSTLKDFDFPDVEYPTTISDIRRTKNWNTQAQFDTFDNNQVNVRQKGKNDKKNKKGSKVTINNKALNKQTSLMANKLDTLKNTSQTKAGISKNLTSSEPCINVSKIVYPNATDDTALSNITYTCPTKKPKTTNLIKTKVIENDSPSNFEEEFTTDDPFGDDINITYLMSTAPPTITHEFDSLWSASEVWESIKSPEYFDELKDYFMLV